MKANFFSWLEHILMFFIKASFPFLTLFLLVSELNEKTPVIEASVSKATESEDTLHIFSNAVILGQQQIRITEAKSTMKYLGPRSSLDFDPMYALLFFLAIVINAIFFWDFSYKNPFTKKALFGLQIGFGILLVFIIANFFRYGWFSQQVKLLTNGMFYYNKPSAILLPEFWILFVLFRLIRIFRKAVDLQKVNDLTV